MPRNNLAQYEEGALLGGMKPRRMQEASKKPVAIKVPSSGGKKSMARFK